MSSTVERSERRRPTVLAVVLTFDAPDGLVSCLRAIGRQTVTPDAVLVVDNASRIPASRVASEAGVADGIEFVSLPENLGPAGGYAEGLRRFLEGDCELAWLLDDDRIPEDGCLDLLVQAHLEQGRPAVIFPTDVDRSGVEVNYPAWCGVVLPRPIVEEVGLPLAELFWWAEDTEYFNWRIPRAGYDRVRVASARVLHRRVVSRRRPAWKYYYETRNVVFYRLRVQGGIRKRRLLVALAKTLGRILALENRRGPKLSMFARGLRDGLKGRLGRTIPVPHRDDTPAEIAR